MQVTSLTPEQKLEALAHRFYQMVPETSAPGDFYTTSRADLELYWVFSVEGGVIATEYLNRAGVDRVTVLVEPHETGFGHRRGDGMASFELAERRHQVPTLLFDDLPDRLVRGVGTFVRLLGQHVVQFGPLGIDPRTRLRHAVLGALDCASSDDVPHRVPRQQQLAADLSDRLAPDEMRSAGLRDRLHNQHPLAAPSGF